MQEKSQEFIYSLVYVCVVWPLPSLILPPKITTTQRGNLSGLVAGAMIYNTTDNRVEVYTGSSWKQLDMSNI